MLRDICAAISLAAALGVPVFASPIQFNFTGVTKYAQAGGPIGETASGSLTFDPATLERPPYVGDASTFATWEEHYWSTAYCPECELVRQSQPSQINGEASARSDALRFGGGFTYDFASVAVFRNYGGCGFNAYRVTLVSLDDLDNWRAMSIFVTDCLGLGTGIFVESDGGLSPAQAIDWFAPGSVGEFNFYEHRQGTRVTEFQGLLTSVQTVKVPEPATLALVGAALFGIAATRRRRPAAPTARRDPPAPAPH